MTVDSSIKPPRPPWWKWLWTSIAALVAVAIVITLVIAIPAIQESARSCADGVSERGPRAECTGITDGSYVYSRDLARVQQLIHRENKSVAASGKPYVSIAVFLPMTLTDDDIVSREWVRHQFQGAYVAQYRANHTASWGSSTPRIKLLLANPGSRLAQWRPVVADLYQRAQTDNLVAVTGIGLSLDNARQAMRWLSDHNIPIIGSHLAADDLSRIPGFLRVSPTSSTYAQAAANYIKPKARKALIVQDANPSDLYPKTLADGFRKTFVDAKHRIVGRTELYDSTLPGVENTFLQMMPNLCGSGPDVVYFAGRENHLRSFVAQLANRSCDDEPITVLTGDLALTDAPTPEMRHGLQSNVTVLGPGLAHPQAWSDQPELFNSASVASFREESCTDCFEAVFPSERLDNGVAILAHDAVLTAVWAVRHAATRPGGAVTARDVLQVRNRLHDELAVPGASGMISFNHRGDPTNKAIPILRVRLHDTPEYLALSAS